MRIHEIPGSVQTPHSSVQHKQPPPYPLRCTTPPSPSALLSQPECSMTPCPSVQYKQPPPPIPKGKTHAPPTGPT